MREEKKGKEGERQARPSEETHAREHYNDIVKDGTEEAKADSGAVGLQGNSELNSDEGGKSVSMRLSKTQAKSKISVWNFNDNTWNETGINNNKVRGKTTIDSA